MKSNDFENVEKNQAVNECKIIRDSEIRAAIFLANHFPEKFELGYQSYLEGMIIQRNLVDKKSGEVILEWRTVEYLGKPWDHPEFSGL